MIYCALELGLVLAGVKGLEFVVVKLQPTTQAAAKPKVLVPQSKTSIKTEAPQQLFTVCIDAGHGGGDGGTTNTNTNRLEKTDNLTLALQVEKNLKELGIGVIMTRTTDTQISLPERCKVANSKKADYFISLHRNEGDGYGNENWISSNAAQEADTLAKNIMTKLVGVGIQKNRGVKRGTHNNPKTNYYVIQYSEMVSCIVEMGFINNEKDNQLFDQNLNAYAKAIATGIKDTWESTHKTTDSKSVTANAAAANEDQTKQKNTTVDTAPKVSNKIIENVDSLDNTIQDWGQGVEMDEQNRPIEAVRIQEKYQDSSALFIMEGSEEIFLTFDIGYENGYTDAILDTLKEKEVKAVFFLTGQYIKEQSDRVKRMIAEGHIVGNHTMSHPADGLPSMSVEQQQQEINDFSKYVKDNYQYEPSLFRYPAGKFSDQSLAVLNNLNYKSVFWSYAYLDYDINNQPDQTESLNKLVERLHPGAIYLLHGESETNAAVLGEFIDQTRAAKYEFKLVE
jgi:delta-lactam-biosynthetic de-N-acetylase